jgi:nucleoside phosphorylase
VTDDNMEMAMQDLLLRRLTFSAGPQQLAAIPWPEGLEPQPATHVTAHNQAMPKADVLVVTWTTAESEALADVLTPGHHRTTWAKYLKGWPEILKHLTGRSPARQAGCAAHFWTTKIGDLNVVVAKSELHLATDDGTAPVVTLWKSMIEDVQPKMVITTGTAGGIGAETVLGDVFIVANAKFNCTREFKNQPWAQQRFDQSGAVPSGQYLKLVEDTLIPVNAGQLKPSGVADRLPKVGIGGDVETVDYFAFADTDDSYGVVKNDPTAHTEEMDDATLPLALEQMGDAGNIQWLSIRNASDPEVPSSIGDLEAQSKWASKIYEKYGYWTTVGSALAVWGVIADQHTVASFTRGGSPA